MFIGQVQTQIKTIQRNIERLPKRTKYTRNNNALCILYWHRLEIDGVRFFFLWYLKPIVCVCVRVQDTFLN